VTAGWNDGGYGYYVIIEHNDGVRTLYGHCLSGSIMVKAGDKVSTGQAIARVGNTGYSFGAHLHFEVRVKGSPVNPAPYLGLN
jgi:murein DD-endopeptidase MepM/ murein hydrolase activator NlpD